MPINDDIPVLCITPSSPEMEQLRLTYVQDNDSERDKRIVGLPEVYASVMETGKCRKPTDNSARVSI